MTETTKDSKSIERKGTEKGPHTKQTEERIGKKEMDKTSEREKQGSSHPWTMKTCEEQIVMFTIVCSHYRVGRWRRKVETRVKKRSRIQMDVLDKERL